MSARIRSRLLNAPKYMIFWLATDAVYLLLLSFFLGREFSLPFSRLILIHVLGIGVGTMVMFTGLGAGMLWIPVLTFLGIRPTEAVSISIFTQIAGKGIGSLTYLLTGMVDMKVALRFIPMALTGAGLGYLSGFFISREYERLLLYIFLMIAGYLLFKMIQSLNEPVSDEPFLPHEDALRKSWPVVVVSSFFTGLLSIGNTDWLIPHMERKLKMPTSRSVATGLFIMFVTTLFFLLLVSISVWLGFRDWPRGTNLLFATCSGVIVGGQIGTRLIRYLWFRKHQKHAFILALALSMVHLLW